MKRVIIPQKEIASTWCAFGAASADILHVHEQVDIQASPFDARRLNKTLTELQKRANRELDHDKIDRSRRQFQFSLDMRHRGQINEVEVMLPEGRLTAALFEPLRQRFYERYEQLYGRGSSYRDARIEIVTPRPKLARAARLSARIAAAAKRPSRPVYWDSLKTSVATDIYDGAQLKPGNTLEGPVIVETTDTTVVVHPGRRLRVDEFGNFEITIGEAA